ncbi:N-formylglutamate deformylase [Pararobbsia silviterrae]|uniref:N-formylglutamate deformylase n=1 Tax=Pararobbsia silviterrae TaxID=1792498 RepID=A0A494Y8J2_9BURK|nr:N-formylglutamate deformylase [Pararobbsia silviterrae]RKP59001.1 N-formylglutamate deformylase [Pararobbsia silviterrae]
MTEHTARPVASLHRGTIPLLISIPHVGTHLPDDIAATMHAVARELDDTDWHLDRLYGFAKDLGASILTPSHSRYVVDLNRPPDGASLYPGRDTTGLFPVDTFDKAPLYLDGQAPDAAAQAARRDRYWQPYHDALRQELDRLKREHGRVLLWEAHSIRSVVPRLFDGRLPDFNFGTADDRSARPGLATLLADRVVQHGGYSAVGNGRFKGGYITRHYGTPERGFHAVQLELTQISYMEETSPYAYDDAKAHAIEPLLKALVTDALAFCTQG